MFSRFALLLIFHIPWCSSKREICALHEGTYINQKLFYRCA